MKSEIRRGARHALMLQPPWYRKAYVDIGVTGYSTKQNTCDVVSIMKLQKD